jgi:hypothetical protein
MREPISINKNVWVNLCVERDWEYLVPLEFQPLTKFVTFFNTHRSKLTGRKRIEGTEKASR